MNKHEWKKGPVVEDWAVFVQTLLLGRPFYFHDDLTDSQVALRWQLSTIVRYCEKKDGTLKFALRK